MGRCNCRSAFDRRGEIAQLSERIRRENVLLLAPRRVGKTSLLTRLRDEIEDTHGFHAVYATAEGIPDELEFLREICRVVESHTKPGSAARAWKRIEGVVRRADEIDFAAFKVKLSAAEIASWQSRADELGELLRPLEGHWFYLIDELPIFVLRLLDADESGRRARSFLEWFRALRQKLSVPDANHHWLLAGSIGLDTVASRNDLSATINDLATQRLGPFTQEIASEFLQKLSVGEGVPLKVGCIEYALEKIGWLIPFHLQLLFSKFREIHEQTRRPLGPADVDVAMESLLAERKDFDGWRERLDRELGATDAAVARAVLTVCARDPAGATPETLRAMNPVVSAGAEQRLEFILRALATDGYLVEHAGRMRFQSPLLREFWLQRLP